MWSVVRWSALMALAVTLTGCGQKVEERLRTYPVSGTLFVAGKPAAGARVRLYALNNPALDGTCPHAHVSTDGSFQLTTYRAADGAPEGTYAVTISWPLPPGPRNEENGPDRFKGRYADFRRSAIKVEITAGANVLTPIKIP